MRASAILITAMVSVLWLACVPAKAQSCGGDVTTVGSLSGTIDPFGGSGGTANGTLTITRASAASGGGKTQDYAFYLVPAIAGSMPSGSQITYAGVNILNTTTSPSLQPPANAGNLPGGNIAAYSASTPSGYLEIGFSGASRPDTYNVTVSLSVSIFTGTALSAGTHDANFSIYYVCKGTGGYSSVTTPTLGSGNVTVSYTVMSGLRATVAGSALAFPDLGGDVSGNVQAGPLNTDIWVASNGPYSVALTSACNWLLSFSGCGGSPVPSPNTVKYNVTLVNQTAGYPLNGSSPTSFTTRTCHAAGIAGINLPITAHTAEAGKGKTPSTSYGDTLSVTFTPLVAAADGSAGSCY